MNTLRQFEFLRHLATIALVTVAVSAQDAARLVRQLDSSESDVRERAVDQLVELGAAAVPALRPVIERRDATDVQLYGVLSAVKRLGARAEQLAPVLAERWPRESRARQKWLRDALACCGNDGARRLADTIQDMGFESQNSMHALLTAARSHDTALYHLIKICPRLEASGRRFVVDRVHSLGERVRSQAAARAWVELLDSEASELASRELRDLGAANAPFVSRLCDALLEGSESERLERTRYLRGTGAAGVAELKARLSDARPEDVPVLTIALGHCGEAAVPALLDQLDSSPQVRWRAIQALVRIGAPAAKSLADELQNKRRIRPALQVLERMSIADLEPALPTLRRVAKWTGPTGTAAARILDEVNR